MNNFRKIKQFCIKQEECCKCPIRSHCDKLFYMGSPSSWELENISEMLEIIKEENGHEDITKYLTL